MTYSPAISTIAEAIQASLSPVFMLTGIGALLNVLAGRLSRVIDRARTLERYHEEADATAAGEERARVVQELRLLARRMSVINAALALAVASAVATCAVVAMLFVGVLTGSHIGQYVAGSFILAMTLLIAAFAAFLIEVRLSIRAIRIRDELLR